MTDLVERFLKAYIFRKRATTVEVVRYGIVGGFAACIEFFSYFLLTRTFGFWNRNLLFAHAVSFLSANIVAFTLHRFWTFQSRRHALAHQYARYLSVTATVLLGGEVLFFLMRRFGFDDLW